MFTPNIVPLLTFYDQKRWMVYWKNDENVLGATNLYDAVYEKNVSRDEKALLLNCAKSLADKTWLDFMCTEGWHVSTANEDQATVGVGTKRTLLLQRVEGERFCDNVAVELLIHRASWSPQKKTAEKAPVAEAAPPGKGRRAARQRRLLGLDDWGDDDEDLGKEQGEAKTLEPAKEPTKAVVEENGKPEEPKPSTSRVTPPNKLAGKKRGKPLPRVRNESSLEFMEDSELSTPIKSPKEQPKQKVVQKKKRPTKQGGAADWSDED